MLEHVTFVLLLSRHLLSVQYHHDVIVILILYHLPSLSSPSPLSSLTLSRISPVCLLFLVSPVLSVSLSHNAVVSFIDIVMASIAPCSEYRSGGHKAVHSTNFFRGCSPIKEEATPPTSKPIIKSKDRMYIVDSGASLHTMGESLPPPRENPSGKSIRKTKSHLGIQTADGIVRSTKLVATGRTSTRPQVCIRLPSKMGRSFLKHSWDTYQLDHLFTSFAHLNHSCS